MTADVEMTDVDDGRTSSPTSSCAVSSPATDNTIANNETTANTKICVGISEEFNIGRSRKTMVDSMKAESFKSLGTLTKPGGTSDEVWQTCMKKVQDGLYDELMEEANNRVIKSQREAGYSWEWDVSFCVETAGTGVSIVLDKNTITRVPNLEIEEIE